MDIRARRIFACSTDMVADSAPVEATPTTAVEKKIPDRTTSCDRRIIDDMRRANLGFPDCQYCPVLVLALESMARLLVSMAETLLGLAIGEGETGYCVGVPPTSATSIVSIINARGTSR